MATARREGHHVSTAEREGIVDQQDAVLEEMESIEGEPGAGARAGRSATESMTAPSTDEDPSTAPEEPADEAASAVSAESSRPPEAPFAREPGGEVDPMEGEAPTG